jgi:hypothetical protein
MTLIIKLKKLKIKKNINILSHYYDDFFAIMILFYFFFFYSLHIYIYYKGDLWEQIFLGKLN